VEIAQKLGMHPSDLSRAINGWAALSPIQLKALAVFLKVKTGDLVGTTAAPGPVVITKADRASLGALHFLASHPDLTASERDQYLLELTKVRRALGLDRVLLTRNHRTR
jgi:hypothetical protein